MGKVRQLLYQSELKPSADRYGDMYSFEACETMHIHWRNLRLEFSEQEWEQYVAAIKDAYAWWERHGKPKPNPSRSLPFYLREHQVGAFNVHAEHNINGRNFRIKDDDLNGPAIHVHYRSNRMEYSCEEFLAIADGFTEAAKKLRSPSG